MSLIKIVPNDLIDLLEKNCNFSKHIDPDLGLCVKLSNYEAYRFVMITGYGFISGKRKDGLKFPRPLFQIYNQIYEYKLQNGLFDIYNFSTNDCTKNIIADYPILTNAKNAYIFPIIYSSLRDFLTKCDILKIKLNQRLSFELFAFIPILKKSKNPANLESFFEYLVSFHYNSLGYITDNQTPFLYAKGTPDLVSFYFPEISDIMNNYKFINNGWHVCDLMNISSYSMRKIGYKSNKIELETDTLLGFEVKTNQKSAKSQIAKYASAELFQELYEIIPVKKTVQSNIGLISYDQNFSLDIQLPKNSIRYSETNIVRYKNWFINYMKPYLLTNLTNEIIEKEIFHEKINSEVSFMRIIKNLGIAKLLNCIENYLI
ncbi:MAG: hypothetical protein HeimC2_11100 [Candidatus Heimdallarchaeota archaeon LC_2]|nr:MAG: hypothetical protein HeimC2_11100 [Candidatus Heimdallarchaeota archaeon LC_2]